MQSRIIATLVLCAAIAGGTILYLNHQKTPQAAPEPVAETPPPPANPQPAQEPALQPKQNQEEPPSVIVKRSEPVLATGSAPVSSEVKPDDAATALGKAVDALLVPQMKMGDKHALFMEVKSAGQLEQVINELKLRSVNNPNDPAILTTLGEAYLSKFPLTDYNETAITGLQVDQSLTAALKIDPANWEAQYFKAYSMSYWPPEMNKGPEVIQRLTSLIDQQEAGPAQPQFAQTYAILGDQYLKSGKPDYAMQTWKLGAQKFPSDPGLLKRIGNR